MYNYLYVIIFLCCYSTISNGQTRTLPDFPAPQNDFYTSLEEDKITNPIFLNGPVREVNVSFTQHESPDRDDMYTENYYYQINTSKEVTKYATDNPYDDATIEHLNIKPLPTIKADTVIKENDFHTYIFKEGKLTNYMMYDIEGGVMDSIMYTYKNDHLLTRTHYRSEGAFQLEDDGEIDESVMYFTEFTLHAYTEASYTNKEQLSTLTHYEFTIEEDLIDLFKNSYTYNDQNHLIQFQTTSDRYFLTRKQLDQHPNHWDLKHNETVINMYLETAITISYDHQDRITAYNRTDSQQNKEVYQITYERDSNKKIHAFRADYSFQKDTIIHRNLMYEYTYDKYHNPIHITSYILTENKKVVDKSTTLNIIYY